MVEPAFLAVLAAIFLLVLVLILRSGGGDSQSQKKQKLPAIKEKKPKGPKKNALKKEKRPVEVKEWSEVYTPAKDAQDMLEFLKGKDPAEIARHTNQQPANKKKPTPKKVESTSSSDSASGNEVVPEGFEVISTKKPKSNAAGAAVEAASKPSKKTESSTKTSKSTRSKAFFKEEEVKEEKKKPREKRIKKKEGEEGVVSGVTSTEVQNEEDKKKQERPKINRPPRDENNRPPRERREKNEGSDEPRIKNNNNPQIKRLPTSPPNVKYEEANLDEILNSITADYKPKPKVHRIGTIFSKIPRSIVISILFRLEARDLLALSEVNHYFSSVARKEPLWKELLLADFGVRDVGKNRGFRAAYRVEYKKKKQQKKRNQNNVPPQDDNKDTKDSSSSEKPIKVNINKEQQISNNADDQ